MYLVGHFHPLCSMDWNGSLSLNSFPAGECPAAAPVTIDEILEALCMLVGGPRPPPGGKPMRLRSIERRAAA